MLAGKVDGPNAPIPHWREYNTTSRRTSLVIDPPDGRFPPRLAGGRAVPGPQRCGSLAGGEPCDTYEDYGLGVRCIVHGEGFPDAMFPAVYNANLRIMQSPGFVAITYELIHDTRVIPIDPPASRDPLSPTIRMYMGDARGHWDGTDAGRRDRQSEDDHARLVPGAAADRALHAHRQDSMQYQVTFTDPATWTAPWTAALDLKRGPDDAGVFEYACHEGNYGMRNMLSAARVLERSGPATQGPASRSRVFEMPAPLTTRCRR